MASEDLLKKAVDAFNALSPEQQAEMLEEQRQSWVRGNVGLSRDERDMTSPMMRALKTVREENSIGRQAVKAWADSNTRPTPVAPVSPDATGTVKTFNQIIDYVMRYGGRCRDCADEDGVCPTNGTPCEPKVKRAVIEHTLRSLEYGLSHGFIENPFSIPAPDATGKCGELVTVKPLYGPKTNICWTQDNTPKEHRKIVQLMPEGDYVTRSQAEELLAAERAEKEAWKNASIELDKAQEAIEADHAAKVEQERLRFEGDLDKWMKIIGAGITGYQPEAYALMDLACEELVKLRADNAALTARVKELRIDRAAWEAVATDIRKQAKALEAKLAAAEKALARAAFGFDQIHQSLMSNGPKQASGEITAFFLAETRAVLGGEPT
ncbi:hypothetical protein FHW02_004306 [Ochrobactrum sp. RH1CCR137]|nr:MULTISPECIES: hypothetical protein [unclassified Ochrobactrum]MBA8846216.1 hypothetical protein [Ochrobactrum sp. RH1CCR137]MBA8858035.1 hypothetical protein [Ochrobactrum sp. RH1CCR134]